MRLVAEPVRLLAVARDVACPRRRARSRPRGRARRPRRPGRRSGARATRSARSNAPSANGRSSARQTTSGRIPGAGSHRDDLEPCLAQPPRDVAAAGGDVERGAHALRPLDDQVEVVAFTVLRALPIGLRAGGPDVGHRAAPRLGVRPSSIVGSTCRFGGPPRRAGDGPPRRSSRRAGRRSDARSSSARAPPGCRARPRRSG